MIWSSGRDAVFESIYLRMKLTSSELKSTHVINPRKVVYGKRIILTQSIQSELLISLKKFNDIESRYELDGVRHVPYELKELPIKFIDLGSLLTLDNHSSHMFFKKDDIYYFDFTSAGDLGLIKNSLTYLGYLEWIKNSRVI